VLAAVGLAYPGARDLWSWLLWLIELAGLVVLSVFFYHSSIGRAAAWGNMVKGMFDLYRFKLLEQLGYKQKPATHEEETLLWQRISSLLSYGIGKPPEYDPAAVARPTSAVTNPKGLTIDITRGVDPPDANHVMKIIVLVVNKDPKDAATGVTVVEQLDKGTRYKWNSAIVDNPNAPVIHNTNVPVSGTNPYKFQVGPLPINGRATLTYEVVIVAAAE
jgi:hypothetical protein